MASSVAKEVFISNGIFIFDWMNKVPYLVICQLLFPKIKAPVVWRNKLSRVLF